MGERNQASQAHTRRPGPPMVEWRLGEAHLGGDLNVSGYPAGAPATAMLAQFETILSEKWAQEKVEARVARRGNQAALQEDLLGENIQSYTGAGVVPLSGPYEGPHRDPRELRGGGRKNIGNEGRREACMLHQQVQGCLTRIDFPKFKGGDPREWIERVDVLRISRYSAGSMGEDLIYSHGRRGLPMGGKSETRRKESGIGRVCQGVVSGLGHCSMKNIKPPSINW